MGKVCGFAFCLARGQDKGKGLRARVYLGPAKMAKPREQGPDPALQPELPQARKRRHLALRLCIGLCVLAVVLCVMLAVAIMAISGRPITLPQWAVAEVEQRMNTAIRPTMPKASISLGGAEVTLGEDWRPRVRARDLRLMQDDGRPLLTLPDLRMSFDAASIPSGQPMLQEMWISGARINVRRNKLGQIDISFGDVDGRQIANLSEALDAIDGAFAAPFLSRLHRIEADGLSVTLRDDRTGRVWQMGDGRLTLDNREAEVAADLSLSLLGAGTPSTARLVAVSAKGASSARVTATVNQVLAADLAAQAAPLGWLAALDAPLSGEFSARLEEGGVADMSARLDIGPGALQPTEDARAIVFSRAGVTMGYDPRRGRLNFSEITIESPALRASATGYADLVDEAGRPMTGSLGGRLPAAFVTQIRLGKVMADPVDLFERPVDFSTGALDLRLRLQPFAIDVGQLALTDSKGTRISAQGRLGAGPGGWSVAMDFAVNRIGRDRLLQLWPVQLVDKTREWLEKNVLNGQLSDVQAALRLTPGTDPRLALSYDFAEGEVRVLPTLPPIVDGRGYATIEGSTYTMVLSQGRIEPPAGGQITVTGSVFQVGDIRQKPAIANVRLLTDGSVTAALSLLDQPPFQFLTKAGKPVDLAEGHAVLDTHMRLPLKPKVQPQDVTFTVTGTADTVRTERLVPGRVVTADLLKVVATEKGLTVTGPGRLGAVGFDMEYQLPFGPETKGRSHLAGTVDLGPEVVDEFQLGLPAGTVGGRGRAQVTVDFDKGQPGKLALVSDLTGVSLSVPDLDWSKPKATPAKLDLGITLTEPPQVDRVSLDAPGLNAKGAVRMGANGMEVARLDRVQVGGWLDAPVELRGKGRGKAPSVVVTGGTVDLRKRGTGSGAGSAGKSGGAKSGGAPLSVALDRLIVTDAITLRGLRGDFTTRDGLGGNFTASLNGDVPVAGVVVPRNGGSAVRLAAQDAGAALASAGIFSNARGGVLDLHLVPRAGQAGVYDGSASIRQLRVQNAPVLAEVLSAISVVGLLEQLNGSGIAFSDVSANFTITPDRVVVSHGAAVGASMGVSMSGTYYTAGKRLAMEGVISPIYMLNAIGRIFTRPGEGLFGFNYRLGGTAQKPEISVNPLSILTPGMFRDLFRSPPPQVKAAE